MIYDIAFVYDALKNVTRCCIKKVDQFVFESCLNNINITFDIN